MKTFISGRIQLNKFLHLPLMVALVGCSGADKEPESVNENKTTNLNSEVNPHPIILRNLMTFLGKQSLENNHFEKNVNYPSIENMIKGSNVTFDSNFKSFVSETCGIDMECRLILEVGYVSEQGLDLEITKNEELNKINESQHSLGFEYINERLKFSLGLQPYTGSILKKYQDSECEIKCKNYMTKGITVLYSISSYLHQKSMERISLNTEIALDRVKVINSKSKSDHEFESLEPLEKNDYRPVVDYSPPVESVRSVVAHTYHDKIKTLSRPKESHQESHDSGKLVLDEVGILEVKGSAISHQRPNTYAEAIAEATTIKNEFEDSSLTKDAVAKFNIKRRSVAVARTDDEYILIE